jgi:hypothetical protein
VTGNADECRARGDYCVRLAAATESPSLRTELLLLAAKWNHLAVYLEGRPAPDGSHDMSSFASPAKIPEQP